jgi:hypothetical protein
MKKLFFFLFLKFFFILSKNIFGFFLFFNIIFIYFNSSLSINKSKINIGLKENN